MNHPAGTRRGVIAHLLSRFARAGFALSLLFGTFAAVSAAAVVATSTPAGAAVSYTCTAPASGGTSTTFTVGYPGSYAVACYGTSGVSGTSAYPSSITLNTGTLPADVTEPTSTSSSPACVTSTTGSGTTQKYILTCTITQTPVAADVGSHPVTFTVNPGTDGGTAATSGTWTLTDAAAPTPSTTCTAPASGGTSTSWTDGTASSYSVACYSTGVAPGNPATYPSSITVASGALPSDAAFPTTVAQGCTQSTSGTAGTPTYEGILTCKVTDTPTTSDNGTYHATFMATGAGGAPNATSGTWTLNIAQAAPAWVTGQYVSIIKNVPFCYDVSVTPASLPLTNMTAGTTPTGFTGYGLQHVNLTAGTAQVCGTDTNTPGTSGAPPTIAPVATNTGGSATDSVPAFSQNECTWTSSNGTVSMFDANQDTEQVGSQSAFGQPISGGETVGVSTNKPTCTGDVGVAASGGLGDAFTLNTANPLPTPTDTASGASQNALSSSNLDLAKGCYGALNILASDSYTTAGNTSYTLTVPSPWANGGNCSYGSLGSNSAGGNTDTTNATCPPSQADVNEGYVSCSITFSSGNDENGQTNYTSMDLFFAGQPVPQTPTATLDTTSAVAGTTPTVNVTGGTNWWGAASGAPTSAATYGDRQNGEMYQVNSPSVYVGTSRGTAVQVSGANVTIPANTYVCTGNEQGSYPGTAPNQPNPCTMTPGQPTGSFQLPGNLSPGTYHVYIDEPNTTPLPGNGPNDAYQTARGTNLGTTESDTTITVTSPLTLTKSSTTSAFGAAGDTINYNYLVSNIGTATLSNIGVTDNKVATVNCPSNTLAGGTNETCTGSYTASQADVDAGSVSNTATATATDPSSNVDSSNQSSVTVPAGNATSAITLAKSTSSTGYGAAGDTIGYSYLVTNSGTRTLSGVGVTDDHVASVSCPNGTLAPGASETCTGTYTVTQADVDAGSVTNNATANATDPQNNAVASAGSSVTVAASNATSGITLAKSTTSTGYGAAGDTIGYSYLVGNDGTRTLSGVSVSDNLIPDVTCPNSTLAPAASETCTGTYTVTQADVDAGSVTNTATANATDSQNNAVSSAGSSVTVAASNAATGIRIAKSTNSSGYAQAGDTINYSYLVTNDGTRTLNGVSVSDNLIPSVSCPTTTLGGGASETCTGSYTVTQADVDAGSVTNTANASGTDSESDTVTSGNSSVTVNASGATSALGIVKSTDSSGYAQAGDTINYGYQVTNTGTKTLHGIGVSDNLISSVSCPNGTLAPNASETCTGTYTVTQADVDAGSVTNTATASGTNAGGTSVTSGSSSVTVNASGATSSIGIVKSTTSSGYGAAGDTLHYHYQVTNSGTRTLHGVGVSDNLIASVNCPNGTLGPNASETCTGTYTVTQADVDAGSVTNTATANATDSASTAVSSAPSSVTVNATGATSSLSLVKSTSATGYSVAGTNLAYSYLVTNTGTSTLSGVGVSDNKVATVNCPNGTLAPGASETCTGTYVTTSGDVSAGSVVNTANANATAPAGLGGASVSSATSSVTVGEVLAFTSGTSASATTGVNSAFTVSAIGGPTPPAITTSSTLPAGVTLVDNGNGTATLGGAPYCTAAGSYPLSLRASDGGTAQAATQSFNLVVATAGSSNPAFDNANSATATAGQPFSFTLQTDCVPLPTVTSVTSLATVGMTLTRNGNGTATVAGTPTAAEAGVHALTFAATAKIAGSNVVTDQAFTLTVNAAPAITSKATASGSTGQAMTPFTVTTTGYPAAAINESGALPANVTLVDNGNGTATLSGTPANGTQGTYPITITAGNGVGSPTTQSFTLTVAQTPTAPVITSPNTLSVKRTVPLTAGQYTATATGYPAPKFSASGLPSGLALNMTTGVMSGKAVSTDALGNYSVTITATNSAGSATQTLTVTVTP